MSAVEWSIQKRQTRKELTENDVLTKIVDNEANDRWFRNVLKFSELRLKRLPHDKFPKGDSEYMVQWYLSFVFFLWHNYMFVIKFWVFFVRQMRFACAPKVQNMYSWKNKGLQWGLNFSFNCSITRHFFLWHFTSGVQF